MNTTDASIYEKNCELANALNLPHKPELDNRIRHSFTRGASKWDNKSTHVKIANKTRYREINFHKRLDLLVLYATGFGMDIITSGDKPRIRFTLPANKGGLSKEVESDSVVEALIDAIILYSKEMELTQIQFLTFDYYLEYFS